MYNSFTLPAIKIEQLTLPSLFLKREVQFDIYLPEELLGNETVNLLLLNDGQDVCQMGMEATLNDLYEKWQIETTVIVAIHAGEERLSEYGIANRLDFKKRGSKAHLYANFIIEELIPFVQTRSDFSINGKRAIAGFSLGGLTAFDLAWNNSSYFDAVGVFSGSFWWRKKDLKDGYTEDDRILHEMIRESQEKPALKYWLMTGTEDEMADRNHNFIIDSIDDTIDVVKALMKKGYKRPSDIFYYEKVGGKHDIETWSKAMPAFLTWAFGK